MVRKLASHKCGPLSIPGVDAVIMWVKFVVGSLPFSQRFFSGCSGFLRLLKNKPRGHVSTSSYVLSAPFIGLQVTILPLLGRPLTQIAVMGCSSRDGSLFIACEGGGGFGAKRGEI